jgi:tetratricopeptide (TPR) repeat protein
VDAHLGRGLAHWRGGRFQEAERCYRSALAIDAHHGDAHQFLADTLRDGASQPVGANARTKKQGEARDRRSLRARQDEAIDQYQAALKLKPDCIEVRVFCCGDVHPVMLEWNERMEGCDRGRTQTMGSRSFSLLSILSSVYVWVLLGQVLDGLGLALMKVGRIDDARDAFLDALALAGPDTDSEVAQALAAQDSQVKRPTTGNPPSLCLLQPPEGGNR